jgi:hypothetical protein
MSRRPPAKRTGVPTGRRRIDGEAMDVAAMTALYGNATEKQTRAQIARGLIPARQWGGRLIGLRTELEAKLHALPRVVEPAR